MKNVIEIYKSDDMLFLKYKDTKDILYYIETTDVSEHFTIIEKNKKNYNSDDVFMGSFKNFYILLKEEN